MKNRLFLAKCSYSAAILMLMGFFPVTCLAASTSAGWMTERKFQRDGETKKKQGMIPVSIDCRPISGRKHFKPELKATWKKNTNGRGWNVQFGKAQDLVALNDKRNLQPVSRKIFRIPSSGLYYYCMLIYLK